MALSRSFLIVVLLCLTGCGLPKHEEWTEQVTLHDGREVSVVRGAWQQWLFDDGQGKAWRYKYSIKVSNPNSGKVVRWTGRWSEQPLIVEFDQGYVYVVFLPEKCNVDMTRYGNPNPPYVVMRRADGWFQRWQLVRLADYPTPLRDINLILRYPLWEVSEQGQTRFPADEVRKLSRPNGLDAGFKQSPIPHNWQSWSYQYKRKGGYGCAGEYKE